MLCRGTRPSLSAYLRSVGPRFRLLPLRTSLTVGRVVTLAAAAFKLLLRGDHSPESVSHHTPRTVALRVAEVLATLTLQGGLWCHLCLHRDSQAAQFG